MANIDKTFFRPSEYDLSVLTKIQRENPHLPNSADLIRAALRAWEINHEVNKSLEDRITKLEAIVAHLQSKLK